ncbi:GbsR/MarR family transcriptional regulator [Ornithinimicrobium cavernae]|uniref:GbsR/MarR family transcriptional regulator n=1 Tax=Ornithinimicrobium cavernae TaxID=2666047 RepID=UPI000D690FDF|nr:MarR family transcriptional regulator [Ornithinimicrobium cavernae]
MAEQVAPQEGPDGFSEAQLAYVEDLAATITASGVQRMPSRVYAAILVSEQGSMTAAQLAATLQVSPAAVSTAVRWLTQVGMVSRRSTPGSRREQYVVDSDSLIRLIAHDTSALNSWTSGFARGLEVVEPGSSAAHRLAELREFFTFLVEEMDGVMQRWQERKNQSSPSRSARKR